MKHTYTAVFDYPFDVHAIMVMAEIITERTASAGAPDGLCWAIDCINMAWDNPGEMLSSIDSDEWVQVAISLKNAAQKIEQGLRDTYQWEAEFDADGNMSREPIDWDQVFGHKAGESHE